MYENKKSRVKCNNEISDELSCCLGVKHGECLSPLLSAMFVNDIEDVLCTWSRRGRYYCF